MTQRDATAESPLSAADDDLEAVLAFLREARGFDFTGYKRTSLSRRVRRRMQDVGIDAYADYLDFLQVHPDEFAALFDTILINVTGFFRDEDAWAYLDDQVVPALLEARDPDEALRVWCAGCSSGEEPYTVAMLLAERLGPVAFGRLKIYATDVDDDALAHGRLGRYSAKAVADVPEALRERYFEPAGDELAIVRDLRRAVIFGRHDLIQDPPISRVDLLTCRNALMYFNPDAQKKVIGSFAYALREDGYLFLGKSEVLVTRSSAFEPVDLQRRVFRKDGAQRRSSGVPPRAPSFDGDRDGSPAGRELLLESTFETTPVAEVVVDRDGVVRLANHQARVTLGIGDDEIGRPLKDLELSYRPVELRSRLEAAYAERRPISVGDVQWGSGADARQFDVQVVPFFTDAGAVHGAAITFADVSRFRLLHTELELAKRELGTAYEELQSTVEELETTNEELQSTNEELETTNEELQSTNEELETMNEELQSTNEELETINDEFRLRTVELDRVNGFLAAIMATLKVGVVVVDDQLRIQVWNAKATDMWGLREDEVQGSYVFGVDIGLPLDVLRRPLQACLAGQTDGEELTARARDRRGRRVAVQLSCVPLRDWAGAIRGVIVLMDDSPEEASPA